MSRTFKDRPVSILLKDDKVSRPNTLISHNHHLAGTTVLNQDGEVVQYPDSCDIGEAHSSPRMCHYWSGLHRMWFPSQTERHSYHSSSRRTERSVLRNLIKIANTDDDDLYGDEVESALTRNQTHLGIWD
jgi:hypothetical protein